MRSTKTMMMGLAAGVLATSGLGGCASESPSEPKGSTASKEEIGRSGGVPGTLVFDIPRNATDTWAHVSTRVEGEEWTLALCSSFNPFGVDAWVHVSSSEDDGMTIDEVMFGFHPDNGGTAALGPYLALFDTRGTSVDMQNESVDQDLLEGSWVVFRVNRHFDGPSVAGEGIKAYGVNTLQNGNCGFFLTLLVRLV